MAVRLRPYGLAFLSSLCIMILELVASRLVARHVGGSLTVWTSVIGIMLAGICLGNILGGRLADRAEPSRVVGPLFAVGTFLTLGSLWVNAYAGVIPDFESLPWLRTILVVIADFLIPTTVLGMVGPVVAKMAVEQSTKSGTAVGNVYFSGAVGSIVGTFIAGFYLIYWSTTTTIVNVVGAGLAFLSLLMLAGPFAKIVGGLTVILLALGSISPITANLPAIGVNLGSTPINPLILAGHFASLVLAIVGLVQLAKAWQPSDLAFADLDDDGAGVKPTLTDLAILSFMASMAFMALEMVAGRLVTRHLGSSIYGWTSVIGVLLGGLSIGNWLGGQIANKVTKETQASWLFMVASAMVLTILFLETPHEKLGPLLLGGSDIPVLSRAITLTTVLGFPATWPYRVLIVTTLVFLLPAIAMGTFSPVVAKLAIERMRKSKRTGRAIGQVYAWGIVGSILGTFLTGFFLIDLLGTKGVLLALAATMAFAATYLGSVWHAAWAGIPLGLCIIAFTPAAWFEQQGVKWGIREEKGNLEKEDAENAWVHESNYYYIKVTNERVAEGKKRTLVLDNLIHGYFILDHPERLDYDYEHIYALVADRVIRAKAKKAAKGDVPPPVEGKVDTKGFGVNTMFLGGGAYTFQRYMQFQYPGTNVDVAEIDPAVLKANQMATGLPKDTTIQTTLGDARAFVERNQGKKQYDVIFGDAFNDFSVPWHLTTREFNEKLGSMLAPEGVYMINIIDVYESDAHAAREAEKTIELGKDKRSPDAIKAAELATAHEYGGFLGAWVKTAKLTFPHVYVFGTTEVPGGGQRETFVVVVSKQPLDLDSLGGRDEDPRFFENDKLFEPKPFPAADMAEIEVRSRGIILTDDYAPVENLLAPVAKTRGNEY